MSAGPLRHVIEIQERTRTVDTGGGAELVWTTLVSGRRRASIVPTTSAEDFVGGQLEERATHKITTRWFPGVASGHRVLFGSRTFDILGAVNPKERRKWWILLCLERKAEQ